MTTSLSRRHLLKGLGYGLAACPICFGMSSLAFGAEKEAAGHAGGAPHWGYDGQGGPENWGKLSADFKVCDLGTQQTPIDLSGAVRAEIGGLEPQFGEVPLTILNNGHTIQVNCAPGSGRLLESNARRPLPRHSRFPLESA